MRVLVLCWLVAFCILVGFSLAPQFMPTPGHSDKFLHVLAYCLLMLPPMLFTFSLRLQIGAALFLLCTGAGVEWAQHILGGRQSSIEDALANVAGIVCGALIGWLIRTGLDANPAVSGREEE